MELVKLSVFAEAYHTGIIYKENIWIKKSSYGKIKDNLPTEFIIEGLDGEHSEIICNIEVQSVWNSVKEYAKAYTNPDLNNGFRLEAFLEYLYKDDDLNLDWESEQEEIKKFFANIDTWETIKVFIPSSKVDKLNKFLETLINQDYNND